MSGEVDTGSPIGDMRQEMPHVPAKACPGLDPGWTPVRRQEYAQTIERTTMIFDYSLAALVTVGLMIYLVYALLRPEQL